MMMDDDDDDDDDDDVDVDEKMRTYKNYLSKTVMKT